MQFFKWILLEHRTRQGCHYDWLLEDPLAVGMVYDPLLASSTEARLVTFRCQLPSCHWPVARRWEVEPYWAHRRVYLTYQGQLSSGRGTVKRVDQGRFTTLLWTKYKIIMLLTSEYGQWSLQLDRHTEKCWTAHLLT